MREKIEEIIENWDKLPKSKNDDGEFVIIAEKDEGGQYEEYKECLGVLKDGTLIWSYLSGCSCDGGNLNEKVTDITAKIFKIQDEKSVEQFYSDHKIDYYEANYKSY